MAVATASKSPADPKHNLQAPRQAYYDKISSTIWPRCGKC